MLGSHREPVPNRGQISTSRANFMANRGPIHFPTSRVKIVIYARSGQVKTQEIDVASMEPVIVSEAVIDCHYIYSFITCI